MPATDQLMVSPLSPVCLLDGVPLAMSRSGVLVHVGEIPRDVDPDHVPQPVTDEEWITHCYARVVLKAAVEDMLAHHAALHPAGDCPWAAKLQDAVRKA